MITSPEQICNLALDAVGWPQAIGSIYEGSKASRIALRIYGQTRDELLRESDWAFARQDIPLVLLKTAPPGGYGPMTPWSSTYPPLPWVYEYQYPPSGIIELRSVRPTPIVIPELDPQPNISVVADDVSLGGYTRVILTNLASAIGIFTGQITDPKAMEPLFIATLVERLAKKFAPALASLDDEKLEAVMEANSLAVAEAHRG